MINTNGILSFSTFHSNQPIKPFAIWFRCPFIVTPYTRTSYIICEAHCECLCLLRASIGFVCLICTVFRGDFQFSCLTQKCDHIDGGMLMTSGRKFLITNERLKEYSLADLVQCIFGDVVVCLTDRAQFHSVVRND